MRGVLKAVWLVLAAGSVVASHATAAADGISPPPVAGAQVPGGQTLRWHVAVVPTQAKPGDVVEVVFTADIASGWILYSSDFNVEIGPRPAKFTFDANPALELVGPIHAVKAQWKKDNTFNTEYSYFARQAEFRQKARLVSPLGEVSGRIAGQTCFEESGLCELFQEKFKASL